MIETFQNRLGRTEDAVADLPVHEVCEVVVRAVVAPRHGAVLCLLACLLVLLVEAAKKGRNKQLWGVGLEMDIRRPTNSIGARNAPIAYAGT